ncbi:Chymotrypsin-like elastase member 1 [Bulinus truncatus]|nr:Chymotrypsin-like elastase member 1 [Bulinus truncatus]
MVKYRYLTVAGSKERHGKYRYLIVAGSKERHGKYRYLIVAGSKERHGYYRYLTDAGSKARHGSSNPVFITNIGQIFARYKIDAFRCVLHYTITRSKMKLLGAIVCLFAIVLAEEDEVDKRIVNGEKAELYAWPHQASLQLNHATYGWYHICGAVLIGENKLVTAAHCLEGQNVRNLRIVVGALLINDTTPYQQTLGVSVAIIHPQYNGNGNGIPNDVGVIYVDRAVTYNKNVQPATLAPIGSSFANTQCVITGWGRVVGGGNVATHLKQAYITKISRAACNNQWIWYGQIITDNHICVYQASDPAGTRPSACNGDSGGPLMCGPTYEYLAGVTSWGVSTCSDIPQLVCLAKTLCALSGYIVIPNIYVTCQVSTHVFQPTTTGSTLINNWVNSNVSPAVTFGHQLNDF